MSSNQACFSPYMLICSTLQTVFGFDRRKEQDKQKDLNDQHQLELRKAKEEFQDELEAKKIADMRAKMVVARRYRAEERYDNMKLQHRTEELKAYFIKCLPIKRQAIPILLDIAENYKELGYDSNCPINVVLLHTKQSALDYDVICDELDKSRNDIGNIEYRRWCDKDVARNSAILNLHAIMCNIPTLVISPYFQDGAIHFTASMWEAQSKANPMIRPLFSIPCPTEFLAPHQDFTLEGKKFIQNKMVLISTIVSGCARDSYMLMTQGLTPTLPLYLKNNPEKLSCLLQEENKELCSFMLNEYKEMHKLLEGSNCPSQLLTKEEIKQLATMACDASTELRRLTNKMIEV